MMDMSGADIARFVVALTVVYGVLAVLFRVTEVYAERYGKRTAHLAVDVLGDEPAQQEPERD